MEQRHNQNAAAAAVTGVNSPTRTSRTATEQPDKDRTDVPRKLTWKEQREYEMLEERIAKLEAIKSDLANAMNRCGDDYVRLQALAEQADAANAELEVALARWFELAEIVEQT